MTEVREKAKRLSNGHLEVDILPESGGKIWNLRHKASGVQWIWHNPSREPGPLEPGASYDDNWAGGWEELFPNDAPGPFRGRDLPDHGEWWRREWSYTALGPRQARLSLECRSIKCRCEKLVTLDDSSVRIDYKITNNEKESIDFMFKQHLAVAVTPDHVIELPGGQTVQVDSGFSTRMAGPGPCPWPNVPGSSGNTVDLSVLPSPEERSREFVYVTELPEGWCGVRNTRTGSRLRMRYPREVFPSTWLFMTFGGWRDLYTLVLEPCTNMPKDMEAALKTGRCAHLGPGETLKCAVTVEIS